VHDTLSTLSREFVVVGKTRVRSWHAWLAIGVVVGIFTGVLYVANRSGEVEKSSAQVPPLPTPSTEYNLAIAKNPLATGGIGKTLANKKVDQTFTAPSDLPLQSVKLALTKVGSPAQQITVSIRETRGGQDLTSAVLIVISQASSDSELSLPDLESADTADAAPTQTSAILNAVATFKSPISLKVGMKYFIVLASDTINRNNFYQVAVDNKNPYAGGNIIVGNAARPGLDAVASLKFAKPSVTVLSPNGKETFMVGGPMTVKWNASYFPENSMVYLELRPNRYIKGAVAIKIAVLAPLSGSYSWRIPKDIIPGDYIIEIYKADINGNIDPNESVKDVSDGPFNITAQPSITVLSPNGGEQWELGTTEAIKWESNRPTFNCGDIPCPTPTLAPITITLVGEYIAPPPCPVGIQCATPPPPPTQALVIANGISDSGLFNWTVGKGSQSIPPGKYRIKITNGSISDASDAPFSVVAPANSVNISKSEKIQAQNIVADTPNQILGGFVLQVSGESVVISSATFFVDDKNNKMIGSEITNVLLYDESGNIVAGPTDALTSGGLYSVSSVTFNDKFTAKVGSNTYTLRGKVSTGDGLKNGSVITIYTSPAKNLEITGQTSGNIINATPYDLVYANPITLRTGALTISVGAEPVSQNFVAGTTEVEFTRYKFDASASAEDIRISSVPLAYTVLSGGAADLNDCKLYDGATAITTGANTVNPFSASLATIFTFDGKGLIVPKGTSKIIPLKCSTRSGAVGSYAWGLDSGQQANYIGATGLTSGQAINETLFGSAGQVMTAIPGGAFTVSLDAGSASYKPVNAGATDVELARIKFSSTEENIDLKQVALQLSDTAQNTPNDLLMRQVSLWTTDGIQIGTAIFAAGDYATSSAISAGAFQIPANGSKVMVIKGSIASICASCELVRSGDLLKVDWDSDNKGFGGTYGIGNTSGMNVFPSGGDTFSAGVRIFRAYPILAGISGWQPSSLANSDQPLFRFSMKANGGDIGIYKLTFKINQNLANLSNLRLWVYQDSSFTLPEPDTAFVNFANGFAEVYLESPPYKFTRIVPNGATRYIELRGSVSDAVTGSYISTELVGDHAYVMSEAVIVDAFPSEYDNFIWTPNSTTTSNVNSNDFTNGYLLPGLPTTNMNPQILSR